MFAVGDKVVHHEFGICKITKISVHQFTGQDIQNYYEMVPFTDDGHGTTYYIKTSQNDLLRKPMDPDQILSMIDSMPQMEPLKIESTGNRVLDAENVKNTYNMLMRSGDPQDLVLLLRTIYRKDQQLSTQKKRISEFESYARENCEHLLYGEIAGVMEIPIQSVEQFITNRIDGEKIHKNHC